uniref:Pc70, similar to Td40,lipocalin 4a-like n=1 Tax=Panstrongylus chinai TaxID=156444 RepID=A0A286T696_9HEMI|nr:Pc70, similar to Td40,lipocalin 4a-like [Panstrongylus chinai]
MRIIIAVVFFGVLQFAFGEYPPDTDACLELEDDKNFNSAKFFKGTWYVTNARYGSNSTVCLEYIVKIRKNGTINIVADGYYDFGGPPRYYRVRCEGTKEYKNGKFYLQCRQHSRGKENKIKFNFQLDWTVVETDYNKFAIVYGCVRTVIKTVAFIEDNLLILHRKKNGLNRNVEETLQLYESSLQNFLSREDSICLPSPVKS